MHNQASLIVSGNCGSGVPSTAMGAFSCRAGVESVAAESVAQHTGAFSGILNWVLVAAASGVLGLIIGFVLIPVVGKIVSPLWQRFRSGQEDADQAK